MVCKHDLNSLRMEARPRQLNAKLNPNGLIRFQYQHLPRSKRMTGNIHFQASATLNNIDDPPQLYVVVRYLESVS